MLVNAVVLAAFAIFVLAHVRSVVRQQRAAEAQHFPETAASFILKNAVPLLDHEPLQLGRIFNLEAVS